MWRIIALLALATSACAVGFKTLPPGMFPQPKPFPAGRSCDGLGYSCAMYMKVSARRKASATCDPPTAAAYCIEHDQRRPDTCIWGPPGVAQLTAAMDDNYAIFGLTTNEDLAYSACYQEAMKASALRLFQMNAKHTLCDLLLQESSFPIHPRGMLRCWGQVGQLVRQCCWCDGEDGFWIRREAGWPKQGDPCPMGCGLQLTKRSCATTITMQNGPQKVCCRIEVPTVNTPTFVRRTKRWNHDDPCGDGYQLSQETTACSALIAAEMFCCVMDESLSPGGAGATSPESRVVTMKKTHGGKSTGRCGDGATLRKMKEMCIVLLARQMVCCTLDGEEGGDATAAALPQFARRRSGGMCPPGYSGVKQEEMCSVLLARQMVCCTLDGEEGGDATAAALPLPQFVARRGGVCPAGYTGVAQDEMCHVLLARQKRDCNLDDPTWPPLTKNAFVERAKRGCTLQLFQNFFGCRGIRSAPSTGSGGPKIYNADRVLFAYTLIHSYPIELTGKVTKKQLKAMANRLSIANSKYPWTSRLFQPIIGGWIKGKKAWFHEKEWGCTLINTGIPAHCSSKQDNSIACLRKRLEVASSPSYTSISSSAPIVPAQYGGAWPTDLEVGTTLMFDCWSEFGAVGKEAESCWPVQVSKLIEINTALGISDVEVKWIESGIPYYATFTLMDFQDYKALCPQPSPSPTHSPSASPSATPSARPSLSPSASPSLSPSASPSKSPTQSPTWLRSGRGESPRKRQRTRQQGRL